MAKEALSARVEFSMCEEIANYQPLYVKQIRWNAMKGIDPQSDLVPSPSNRNLNSVFSDKLNLSTIDLPNNRMQRTLENIEVENQNLNGSQSNVNCIDIGEFSRPSVLQQVWDQNSPGPGLTLNCNTFRDSNGRSCENEVNNQNLHGFNLSQSNTVVVSDPNYQPYVL